MEILWRYCCFQSSFDSDIYRNLAHTSIFDPIGNDFVRLILYLYKSQRINIKSQSAFQFINKLQYDGFGIHPNSCVFLRILSSIYTSYLQDLGEQKERLQKTPYVLCLFRSKPFTRLISNGYTCCADTSIVKLSFV